MKNMMVVICCCCLIYTGSQAQRIVRTKGILPYMEYGLGDDLPEWQLENLSGCPL